MYKRWLSDGCHHVDVRKLQIYVADAAAFDLVVAADTAAIALKNIDGSHAGRALIDVSRVMLTRASLTGTLVDSILTIIGDVFGKVAGDKDRSDGEDVCSVSTLTHSLTHTC